MVNWGNCVMYLSVAVQGMVSAMRPVWEGTIRWKATLSARQISKTTGLTGSTTWTTPTVRNICQEGIFLGGGTRSLLTQNIAVACLVVVLGVDSSGYRGKLFHLHTACFRQNRRFVYFKPVIRSSEECQVSTSALQAK